MRIWLRAYYGHIPLTWHYPSMAVMLDDWWELSGGRTWYISGFTWNPLFSRIDVTYWNGSIWQTYTRIYSPPPAWP